MQLIWSVRISSAFSGVTKIRVESGRAQRLGEALGDPACGAQLVGRARQIDDAAARADLERRHSCSPTGSMRIGDLVLGALAAARRGRGCCTAEE